MGWLKILKTMLGFPDLYELLFGNILFICVLVTFFMRKLTMILELDKVRWLETMTKNFLSH